MAKKRKRKYSKSSGSDVKNEMHRYKRGKAKSGPGVKAARSRVENKQSPLAFPRPARRERKYRRKSPDQRMDLELRLGP